MYVTAFRVEFFIPGAKSLKERRKVVLSIKERLKKVRNFSVVEVPVSKEINRAILGIAFISANHDAVSDVSEELHKLFESYPVEIIDFWQEVFPIER